VDDHVTLARGVAAGLGVVELDRVRRVRDVDDAEAAPVALEGGLPLKAMSELMSARLPGFGGTRAV
jgi:hypothetical protein